MLLSVPVLVSASACTAQRRTRAEVIASGRVEGIPSGRLALGPHSSSLLHFGNQLSLLNYAGTILQAANRRGTMGRQAGE